MRRRDGKIFLLDFGAVKQVTNAPAGANASSTGIYSLGFAPPEQMAGNQVFPSTDLYALAVTILTLVTGQEASKLFDAYTNQWNWRGKATVNPHLADILDKMLLPAANQRFQSAQDVLDALVETNTPQFIPPTQPPDPTIFPTSLPSGPVSHPVVSPPPTPPAPPPTKANTPAFSTLELLTGAAFSGFEGALIGIALFSLLHNPTITLGISAVILGILIFAQTRRWIERFDLLIISGLTFAIIFFMKFLQAGLGIEQVVFLAIAAALVTIALTALFRLIYKLLSLIL
jgi:serine/threonine-protein kinase